MSTDSTAQALALDALNKVNSSTKNISSNTIILLGDSITNQIPLDGTNYFAESYFTWTNIILGHRLEVIHSGGVSGNNTSQMLARIKTDVLNYKPNWCVVEACVNDVTQNVSYQTITGNLLNIYSQLQENGIKVIATTVTSNNAWTTSQIKLCTKVNNWIRNYCLLNPNVLLCDWYSNMTGVDGKPVASLFVDGLHPNAEGAYIMGKKLAETMINYVKYVDRLPHNFDDYNLLLNPRMIGATNGKANNWDFAGSNSTYSKVTRTDGVIGTWQQVNVTTANQTILYSVYLNAITEGTELYGIVEFEKDTFTSDSYFYLELFLGGTNNRVFDCKSGLGSSVHNSMTKGVFMTPKIIVPEGVTYAQLGIYFDGVGTYRIDKAGIIKSV